MLNATQAPRQPQTDRHALVGHRGADKLHACILAMARQAGHGCVPERPAHGCVPHIFYTAYVPSRQEADDMSNRLWEYSASKVKCLQRTPLMHGAASMQASVRQDVDCRRP